MDAATFTNDNMPSTDTFDQLKQAVQASPPKWRMRTRSGMLDMYDADQDDNGEQITITPANLDRMASIVGRVPRFEPALPQVAAIVGDYQRGAFLDMDPPNIARLSFWIARSLSDLFITQTGGVYLAAFHAARRLNLIAGDQFAASFLQFWTGRALSAHPAIVMQPDEIAAMFTLMGEDGPFYANQKIKRRDDLPGHVVLHRGMAVQGEDAPNGWLGFSWSPDRRVAERFARQRQREGHGQGIVATATFAPPDILAVLEMADMDEWIVGPDARPQSMSIERLN